MKKDTLWLIGIAAVLYFVFKKAPTAPADQSAPGAVDTSPNLPTLSATLGLPKTGPAGGPPLPGGP